MTHKTESGEWIETQKSRENQKWYERLLSGGGKKENSLIWWQLHTIILIDGGSCSAFGVTRRRRCWSLRDQFGDLTRQAPSKRKCTRSLFHSGLLCHDHDSAAPSTRIPPAYVNVNNSDNTLRLPNWNYFGSLVRSVGRSFTCNNIRKVPMRLKYTLRSTSFDFAVSALVLPSSHQLLVMNSRKQAEQSNGLLNFSVTVLIDRKLAD